MNYTEAIYLYGIKRLRGERTVSGLFHILNGKKSSQAIQDGKLFSLSNLFGTMPNINYAKFTSSVQMISAQGWITLDFDDHPHITEMGNDRLEKYLMLHPLPVKLNGWRYGDISKVFWRRLTLFVQTLSHLLENDSHFYPIQNDPTILSWVKDHFPNHYHVRVNASEMLYTELFLFLKKVDPTDAENVVQRLTRHGRIGKTSAQVAQELQLDPVECDFRFQATIHHLINQLLEDGDSFPGLYLFISDLHQPYTLTESTLRTLNLLRDGIAIKAIAAERRLKLSTIEDHIIEIAINVLGFSIDPYVSFTEQEEIINTSKGLNTKRLKAIKERLGDRYTYFQIRLTLTNMDDQPDRCKEGEFDAIN
ncbi:helix-turn-helix domain-containing protein [Alkalihalobacillus sp. AL-G]|uniref:helix-turn-helix domain-containing protein n=1 Tax=Alkalihalobacillus sp. AL-G TaxID=2926399 RepID=UPI00272AF77A|nr:helix-turn-helix domain-containing protein [Alkalihalobacillus sp. AL-G]WLD91862.1 helix-turn-helix domain-containing protein [Alkalihalobacillus sp. AL-G]